jgi:endonuclease YncB( thermonuclease family)
MPFILIKGTFHLVNQNKKGTLVGFEPDGDSIQFKPDKPSLLDKLTRLQQPYRLTNIGSVQLRMEGIDALEIHFQPTHGGPRSHQPRQLADQARDFLTGELGLNPVPYAPPNYLRVKPPIARDGASGYIFARALEVHGRPVAFAFAGNHPAADGSEIHLTTSLLKKSLNYRLVSSCNAYPLFYDTLFGELRDVLATAARQARASKQGLWKFDLSQRGLKVTSQADLETNGVIFPKLFRRLTDFLAETNGNLAKFPEWLKAKGEQVLDLDKMNFTHFDNIVSVRDGQVSLKQLPERIVFVSQK